MFERYTERARRVLFFARYEASQLGSTSIDTDHLLLGLIREGKGLTNRLFATSKVSLEDLRREIEGLAVFRERVSESVEMPFSEDAKRVLELAAGEADRLRHDHIGTEHLLLGLLGVERSRAGTLLAKKGMRADEVRESLVRLLNEGEPSELVWKSRSCCFCGEGFPTASAALLVVISGVENRAYSQNLYSHPHCLRARVRADVRLIADAADDQSARFFDSSS